MTLWGTLHSIFRRHRVVVQWRDDQWRPTDECEDCGRVWHP